MPAVPHAGTEVQLGDLLGPVAIPGWSEHAVPERMSNAEVYELRGKVPSRGVQVACVSGRREMSADGTDSERIWRFSAPMRNTQA